MCVLKDKKKGLFHFELFSDVDIKNNKNIISGRNPINYTRLRPFILLLNGYPLPSADNALLNHFLPFNSINYNIKIFFYYP